MDIVLICKPSGQQTGIGRYADELERQLRGMGHRVRVVYPIVPLPKWLIERVKHLMGWDLEAFLNNYPVMARYPKGADIYHITSQNLATLMIFCPPPGKVVVTVHDIIPFLFRNNREICVRPNRIEMAFIWLSGQGLKRASNFIAVSEQTNKTLFDHRLGTQA
jgi:hypothetical protein